MSGKLSQGSAGKMDELCYATLDFKIFAGKRVLFPSDSKLKYSLNILELEIFVLRYACHQTEEKYQLRVCCL